MRRFFFAWLVLLLLPARIHAQVKWRTTLYALPGVSHVVAEDRAGIGGAVGVQYGVEYGSLVAGTGLNLYYLRSTIPVSGFLRLMYQRYGQPFLEIPFGIGAKTKEDNGHHFEFKGDVAYLTTMGFDKAFLALSPYAAIFWKSKKEDRIGLALKGTVSTQADDDYRPSFIGLGLIYKTY
jgi:hypothetical protein